MEKNPVVLILGGVLGAWLLSGALDLIIYGLGLSVLIGGAVVAYRFFEE